MSVIVRGMEMPDCCLECPFCISNRAYNGKTEDGWLMVKDTYYCEYTPEEIEDGWIDFDAASKSRQSWCPLEEVAEGEG